MKDDKEPEPKIPLIGISLRNWYAGMALNGLNANADISKEASKTGMSRDEIKKSYIKAAWEQADAMIEASQKCEKIAAQAKATQE